MTVNSIDDGHDAPTVDGWSDRDRLNVDTTITL